MSFKKYLKEVIGNQEWREKQIKMRAHRIENKIAEGDYEIETTVYLNGNKDWELAEFPISFNLDCWGSHRGARSSLGVPEEPDEEAGCHFDGIYFQMTWEEAKKEYKDTFDELVEDPEFIEYINNINKSGKEPWEFNDSIDENWLDEELMDKELESVIDSRDNYDPY